MSLPNMIFANSTENDETASRRSILQQTTERERHLQRQNYAILVKLYVAHVIVRKTTVERGKRIIGLGCLLLSTA